MWKALLLTILAVGVFAGNLEHANREGWLDILNDPALQQMIQAAKTFGECMKDQLVFDDALKEIREAVPKGTVNEVVGKYCSRLPQIKSCYKNFLEGTSQYVRHEIPSYNVTEYIVSNEMLMDYICHNSGSRLTTFLQDGGFECITTKKEDLRSCTSLYENTKREIMNMSVDQKCAKLDELTNCFVSALRGCASATPSNIAEEFFHYMRTEAPPCDNINVKFPP